MTFDLRQSGFDTLHAMIPSLAQNPSAKISKANMLQKGGSSLLQTIMVYK